MTRLKRDDLSEQNMKAEKRQFLKGNHELKWPCVLKLFSPQFWCFTFPFYLEKDLRGWWCTSIRGLLIVHSNSALFLTSSAGSLNEAAHHDKHMPFLKKSLLICDFTGSWVNLSWCLCVTSQCFCTNSEASPSILCPSLSPPFPQGALEGCPLRSWLLSGEVRALQGLPAWWRRNGGLQQNRDT